MLAKPLLQPDIIKLDTNLLHLAGNSESLKKAFNALVAFIHDLGAKCIVEGVECEETLSIARNSGADFLQGYYLARPELVMSQSNSLHNTLSLTRHTNFHSVTNNTHATQFNGTQTAAL